MFEKHMKQNKRQRILKDTLKFSNKVLYKQSMHSLSHGTPCRHKKLLSAILLVLAILLFTVPHISRATTPMDARAQEYLDETLVKASAAFAATKALNAVISLVQESSIQLQPLGVGLDLAAGQVLDPINDLVERTSWIFLAAMTSVGIQHFLLRITPWLSVEVLLSIALALYGLGLWSQAQLGHTVRVAALKIAITALVLRLMVPLSVMAYDHIDTLFLAQDYQHHIGAVQQAEQNMEGVHKNILTDKGKAHNHEQSWLEKLTPAPSAQGLVDSSKAVHTAIRQITSMASKTGDTLIRLGTIFVIQTMLLPLFTLWLLTALTKGIVRYNGWAGKGENSEKNEEKNRC